MGWKEVSREGKEVIRCWLCNCWELERYANSEWFMSNIIILDLCVCVPILRKQKYIPTGNWCAILDQLNVARCTASWRKIMLRSTTLSRVLVPMHTCLYWIMFIMLQRSTWASFVLLFLILAIGNLDYLDWKTLPCCSGSWTCLMQCRHNYLMIYAPAAAMLPFPPKKLVGCWGTCPPPHHAFQVLWSVVQPSVMDHHWDWPWTNVFPAIRQPTCPQNRHGLSWDSVEVED